MISLENLWLQQFKIDFLEGGKHDDVKMSREDHQFMNMVMESVKLIDSHYSIYPPPKNRLVKMSNNHSIASEENTESSLKLLLKRATQ